MPGSSRCPRPSRRRPRRPRPGAVPAALAGTALLLLLFLAGCGSEPSSGPGGDGPVALRLAGPDLRIGSVDDPAYAFGPVGAMTPGPDGRLYSLHRGEAAVRVWDADGRPAGTVGRAGDGPGEFRFPSRLGFFGDSLWVVDGANRRVSFFDPHGAFVGSELPQVRGFQPGELSGEAPANPWLPRRDGTWWGRGGAPSTAVAAGEVETLSFVLMTDDGTVSDTVWVKDLRPTDAVAWRTGERTMVLPPLWDDVDLAEFRASAELVAVERRVPSASAEEMFVDVRWLGPEGDTLAEARIPDRPRPLGGAAADSAIAERASAVHRALGSRGPGLAELERALREGVHVPRFLPAVREVVPTEDGAAWLRRWSPGEDGGDRWWIVERDAGLVGDLRAPAGLRILHVTGDTVWGVERDELDVEYLVRYRVEPVETP